MLTFNYQNGFHFFLLDEAGNKIPVSCWKQFQENFLAQFSILYELYENGRADFTQYECLIETLEILKLNEINKQILGLPEEYPFELYIQSDGQLNQTSFKFKYGFYDFAPNGTRFQTIRNGAILSIQDKNYLLSEAQYQICEALDEFNRLPESERTFSKNLIRFADIKSLSQSAASKLDSYLQNQDVYRPDKIKIDIDFQQDTLEIIPTIGIENESSFINTYDRLPVTRDVYPISQKNGKVTRVVLDSQQQEQLQKVKKIRKVKQPQEIEQIVENPEQF
ncbi:MAG: hypothetical protein NZ108_07065, partial [Bacteroidia bacterium]|nr:hypothetical protein [Bacteroidia bacterium]